MMFSLERSCSGSLATRSATVFWIFERWNPSTRARCDEASSVRHNTPAAPAAERNEAAGGKDHDDLVIPKLDVFDLICSFSGKLNDYFL